MKELTEKQQEIVAKLRERYGTIHPVLFQRMLDRAKNEVELFDILDTAPATFPLVWDINGRRLTAAMDILGQGLFPP
jgi:hypothetical protein